MEDLKFIEDIDFDDIEEIEKRISCYEKPCAVFYKTAAGKQLVLPTKTEKFCDFERAKLAKSGKYLLILKSNSDNSYKVVKRFGQIHICVNAADSSGVIPRWVWEKKVLPVYKCKGGLAIPMPADGPEAE